MGCALYKSYADIYYFQPSVKPFDMKYLIPLLLNLFLMGSIAHAQEVISLYGGTAPGSEGWKYPETADTTGSGLVFIRNVSHPTLTVFQPAALKNKTAVIVCPGGAFRGLAIEKEGYEVARWLNSKGITAFVLKYRLVNAPEGFDPMLGRDIRTGNFARIDSINAPFVPFAVADGREAVRYVRRHAAEFGVEPGRIGMLGFSAGGTLIASVAQTAEAESRPDFIGLIYAYCGAILGESAPADAPPLFQALAGDDPIANGNPELYQKWRDAGRPAELHIFPEGGHGFALQKQSLPVDLWTDRYMEWLQSRGLLLPPEEADRTDLRGHWRWRRYWDEMLRTDFGGLKRYAEANQKLMPPEKTEKRVVFFGNSITEGWIQAHPEFFAGKPYVNRGIGGQTTPQMLIRFRQDVVALKPAVVVILAGTNDIAGNTGPTTLKAIFDNITSMAEIARANGIRVVISSVLPAADYPWAPGLGPAEKIVRLNAMLKEYAGNNRCVYLDYHSAMKDDRNGLPHALARDEVHPTLEGYKIMEPLVERAIAEALKLKQGDN